VFSNNKTTGNKRHSVHSAQHKIKAIAYCLASQQVDCRQLKGVTDDKRLLRRDVTKAGLVAG
jgi:hypothetical protein